MATFLISIQLRPVVGREDEFHEWYENTHLDDVLQTTGFTSAQRFGLRPGGSKKAANSHLALYFAEGASAEEVLDRLHSTRGERNMAGAADVADPAEMELQIHEALGPLHTPRS